MFATQNAALCVNEKLIVTVWDGSIENSEQILNASLLLATNHKKGFLKLYALPFVHQLELDGEVSFDEHLLSDIQSDILQKIETKFVADGGVLPEFDCYQNAKGASLPLILSGMPYSKTADLINQQEFIQISAALTAQINHDLVHLVDLLLSSARLSCHFQFQAEANHYLLQAIDKFTVLSWSNVQPSLLQYQQKMQAGCAISLANSMSPIEYIKMYRVLAQSLKTSYLGTL